MNLWKKLFGSSTPSTPKPTLRLGTVKILPELAEFFESAGDDVQRYLELHQSGEFTNFSDRDAFEFAKKAFDVGSIKDQLGKQPMRELIRGEIEVVEKNLILAALELTGNNRAATAKVLGISRQSLYQKLSRYGLEES